MAYIQNSEVIFNKFKIEIGPNRLDFFYNRNMISLQPNGFSMNEARSLLSFFSNGLIPTQAYSGAGAWGNNFLLFISLVVMYKDRFKKDSNVLVGAHG